MAKFQYNKAKMIIITINKTRKRSILLTLITTNNKEIIIITRSLIITHHIHPLQMDLQI